MIQINTPINKRGLPGVTSNSHHLAFFENKTFNKPSKQYHSKFSPLVETLLIFCVLVVIYLIITSIIFGVRGYCISLHRRKKLSLYQTQPGQSKSSNSCTNDSISLQAKNPKYEAANSVSYICDPTKLQHKQKKSGDDIDNVFISSINILKKEIVRYTAEGILSLRAANNECSELTEMVPFYQVSVEQVIKSKSLIENIKFLNPLNAEKELYEINQNLLAGESEENIDNCTKTIALFRLFAIGANSASFENPNIFLYSFNNCLEQLIDTGRIFHLLREVNVYFAQLLVDLVIQYSYVHWHIKREKHFINKLFQSWPNTSPSVQSDQTIFRFLVNLELGLVTVNTFDMIAWENCQNKLKMLIRFFSTSIDHSDTGCMVSMVTQAIEFSDKHPTKTFFYEILEIILETHSGCCLAGIFRYNKRELKASYSSLHTKLSIDSENSIKRIRLLSIKMDPELET